MSLRYCFLFSYLVERVNESIGWVPPLAVDGVDLVCGILDMFGFESFTSNSLEQLCINYTNELLQQFFNEYIFKQEEQLYKAEGITWNPLDFPDNLDCLSLISKASSNERNTLASKLPSGIFELLDEESFMPKGSDSTFHSKICKTLRGQWRPVHQPNFEWWSD